MVCFVVEILLGGTDESKADVIERLGQIFTIDSWCRDPPEQRQIHYNWSEQLCQSYPTHPVVHKPTHRKELLFRYIDHLYQSQQHGNSRCHWTKAKE